MAAKKLLADEKTFGPDYLVRKAVEKLSIALNSSTLTGDVITDALQDLVIARIKIG